MNKAYTYRTSSTFILGTNREDCTFGRAVDFNASLYPCLSGSIIYNIAVYCSGFILLSNLVAKQFINRGLTLT